MPPMDLFFEAQQEGPPSMSTSSTTNPTTPPAEFALAMRGYDRVQVDEYLAAQEGWLAEAEARIEESERTSSLAVLETEQLRQRLAQIEERDMAEPPRSIEALGERVGRILDQAWEAAEKLRTDAAEAASQQEAASAERVDEAERRREEIQREAAEALEAARRQSELHLEEARTKAERTSRDILADARAEAQRLVEEGVTKRDELEGEIDALNQRGETAVIELDRVKNTLEQALAEAPIVLHTNGDDQDHASTPPPRVI